MAKADPTDLALVQGLSPEPTLEITDPGGQVRHNWDTRTEQRGERVPGNRGELPSTTQTKPRHNRDVSERVMTSEEDACRVLADRVHDLPDGDRVVASRVGGTNVWSVGILDDKGRPYLGAAQFVGPDGRLWRFSSNPSIHDLGLVRRVLVGIYDANAADLVDEDVLLQRVHDLTATMSEAVRAVVKDGVAGSLRAPHERPPLP